MIGLQRLSPAPLSAGLAWTTGLLRALFLDDQHRALDPLRTYWALFIGSIICMLLARSLSDTHGLGMLATSLALLGSASCGWAWLLTRALFNPKGATGRWPVFVVAGLIGVVVIMRMLEGVSGAGPTIRILGNLQSLASSAILVMTFVEVFHGLSPQTIAPEKRFRVAYGLGYAGLIALAVLWTGRAEAGSFAARAAPIMEAACATLALALGSAAVWFRRRHPLPASIREAGKTRRTATETDRAIADRVLAALGDHEAFTTPNLKVADVADMLGEQSYRVTNAIAAATDFPNFNRLINHLRVELAKEKLGATTSEATPILTIALDCGFASIGPFNRAFKAETGQTPREYRTALRPR